MEIERYITDSGVDVFAQWFSGLNDSVAKAAIARRLDRVKAGNFGATRFLGGGVSELKIDVGQGYRIYYAQSGQRIILLLGGGDKRSQDADIAGAISSWAQYKRRTLRKS